MGKQNPRIALTVPTDLNDTLQRLADLQGVPKTKIILENNVDIVIELPFVYATQSSDIFAKGALEILNHLKIDTLVFGSECNDVNKLIELANIQLNNKDYDLSMYIDDCILNYIKENNLYK